MATTTVQAQYPQQATAIDPLLLRGILGRFVTGVTIATTRAGDVPVGLTVNSFTSVSLDPPLVLFCVNSRSRALSSFQQAGVFAINILGVEQEAVSRLFAKPDTDRFANLDIRTGFTGAPILSNSLAFLDCRIVGEYEGGDHLIVLGEVVDLGVLQDGEPLAFFKGAYGRLGGHD
jgi:3-hydroxy-9,10-secoandrosta-1,3,5(10)-triene-9,17-dione monooxygenase reductase component